MNNLQIIQNVPKGTSCVLYSINSSLLDGKDKLKKNESFYIICLNQATMVLLLTCELLLSISTRKRLHIHLAPFGPNGNKFLKKHP